MDESLMPEKVFKGLLLMDFLLMSCCRPGGWE
jgi:hypothetical protein